MIHFEKIRSKLNRLYTAPNVLCWARRFACYGVATIILVNWFSSNVAVAQSGPDSAQKVFSQRQYPWYDAETDAPSAIEFSERAPAKSADRNNVPLGAPTKTSNRGGGGSSVVSSGISAFAWTVLAVVLAVVASLLIWAFFKIESQKRNSAVALPKRSREESIEQLPFEVEQTAGDFRQMAQQSQAKGDFRRAAIYLFSHVLVTLDQAELIRLKKGKTNRQYLLELKAQPHLSNFYQQTMVPFESVFFGDHDLSAAEFSKCWQNLDGFEYDVNQSMAVAP